MQEAGLGLLYVHRHRLVFGSFLDTLLPSRCDRLTRPSPPHISRVIPVLIHADEIESLRTGYFRLYLRTNQLHEQRGNDDMICL